MSAKRPRDPRERELVRDELRQLLARAPAFRALAPDERRRLGASLEGAATTLVDGELDRRAGKLDPVDLPAFVSELVGGTFAAIVDATVQQMREYGELLGQAAASVEDFAGDGAGVVAFREELAGLLRAGRASAKRDGVRTVRRPLALPLARRPGDDGSDDDD